jgi:hypothetical protein
MPPPAAGYPRFATRAAEPRATLEVQMDPNNQQPAQQQPPWGAPPPAPAPQQPGWGAPPPADPMAWGAPPPAQKPSLIKRLAPALVAVVVLAVVAVVAGALFGGGSGKIYFSKATYDTTSKSCSFNSTISSATTTDDVYLLADLKDTVPASGKATMEIFKDGVSQGTEDISEGTEYNCYYIKSSIGPLDAGVWKITITYNGKVEAEGSITITK